MNGRKKIFYSKHLTNSFLVAKDASTMLSRFASDSEINFVMFFRLIKQQQKHKRALSMSCDTDLWRDLIYTKSAKRLAYHLAQKVVFTFRNESQFSSPQKARLAGAYYQVHPRLGTTTA